MSLISNVAALYRAIKGTPLPEPLPELSEWDGTLNGRTYRARPGDLICNGRIQDKAGMWVDVHERAREDWSLNTVRLIRPEGFLPWSLEDLRDVASEGDWTWGIANCWGVLIARFDDKETAEQVVAAANK